MSLEVNLAYMVAGNQYYTSRTPIKFIIGGIYRVPNTNIDRFLEKFNSIIEPLKSTHKITLLGYYNIDLQKK